MLYMLQFFSIIFGETIGELCVDLFKIFDGNIDELGLKKWKNFKCVKRG